jgi:hypothetical protein
VEREETSSVDLLVQELLKELDMELVAARLRLTPTERVEKMRRFLQFAEDLRAARADRVPKDH